MHIHTCKDTQTLTPIDKYMIAYIRTNVHTLDPFTYAHTTYTRIDTNVIKYRDMHKQICTYKRKHTYIQRQIHILCTYSYINIHTCIHTLLRFLQKRLVALNKTLQLFTKARVCVWPCPVCVIHEVVYENVSCLGSVNWKQEPWGV